MSCNHAGFSVFVLGSRTVSLSQSRKPVTVLQGHHQNSRSNQGPEQKLPLRVMGRFLSFTMCLRAAEEAACAECSPFVCSGPGHEPVIQCRLTGVTAVPPGCGSCWEMAPHFNQSSRKRSQGRTDTFPVLFGSESRQIIAASVF